MESVRTLSPDTFVEFFRIVEFPFVRLGEVDMDVKAAALAVGDGVDEFRVGFAFRFCWRVDEGFSICCFLTVITNVTSLTLSRPLGVLLRQRFQPRVAFERGRKCIEEWIRHFGQTY